MKSFITIISVLFVSNFAFAQGEIYFLNNTNSNIFIQYIEASDIDDDSCSTFITIPNINVSPISLDVYGSFFSFPVWRKYLNAPISISGVAAEAMLGQAKWQTIFAKLGSSANHENVVRLLKPSCPSNSQLAYPISGTNIMATWTEDGNSTFIKFSYF